MKKKFIYIIFGLLAIISLGTLAPHFWDIYHYLPIQKKEIHIFFENYATAPALSHMVEFSKLDKNTRKIIGWNRFPNRAQLFDLKAYNTVEIPMQKDPRRARENLFAFATIIFDEINKNPSANLVLHSSFDKVASVLKPLLTVVPKQRIKEIHLYEDGYGDVFKWTDDILNQEEQYSKNLKTETETLLNSSMRKAWHIRHVFGLRELYPVTYHFLNASKMKDIERFSKLNELLKDANVKDINFDNLSKTLTDEQKQIVYQLSGFNYEYFKNLMSDKKSIMFVTGFYFNDNRYIDAEMKVLSLIRENKLTNFNIENPQDYVWLFKPHPATNDVYNEKELQEKFPNIVEVPSSIPFEIFILADLKPTLTAGFSSSLFFSLNENDVLFYAKRPKYNTSPLSRLDDHYLASLIKDKLIRNDQVILYENYFTESILMNKNKSLDGLYLD